MNITDMLTNLKLEIDKSDTLDSVGFETIELIYWLNSAIRSFANAKYKGSSSARGEAFEQNQKRIDDLRTLIEEERITVSRGTLAAFDKPDSYLASLPSSNTYWYTLGEEVRIAYQTGTTAMTVTGLTVGDTYKVSGDVIHDSNPYIDGDYFIATQTTYDNTSGQVYLCAVKRQGITETTADTYTSHIDDPYSEHKLENYSAKPLRLFKGSEVELITDGAYGVYYYYIRYLFQPATVADPGTDCDLPEHTHDEIVKMAADMILENTGNPRYQTHLNETNKVNN